MVDLGHWVLYPGVKIPENFETKPPLGFVYKITNKKTNRFYIGQKKIYIIEKKPPLKGKVRVRHVQKETPWRKYCGSSHELQRDVLELGENNFTFEILEFCECQWLLSYEELRLQMLNNVLLRNDTYNGIVNVRLSKFDSMIEKYGKQSKIVTPF